MFRVRSEVPGGAGRSGREFKDNLEKLLALVNDEVLHAYADELIGAIEAPSGPMPKTVTVSAGNYFE